MVGVENFKIQIEGGKLVGVELGRARHFRETPQFTALRKKGIDRRPIGVLAVSRYAVTPGMDKFAPPGGDEIIFDSPGPVESGDPEIQFMLSPANLEHISVLNKGIRTARIEDTGFGTDMSLAEVYARAMIGVARLVLEKNGIKSGIEPKTVSLFVDKVSPRRTPIGSTGIESVWGKCEIAGNTIIAGMVGPGIDTRPGQASLPEVVRMYHSGLQKVGEKLGITDFLAKYNILHIRGFDNDEFTKWEYVPDGDFGKVELNPQPDRIAELARLIPLV
jgi:hypothetical protein